MAIREECEKCKDYRKDLEFCSHLWENPVFDGQPCKKNMAEEQVASDTTSGVISEETFDTKSASGDSLHDNNGVCENIKPKEPMDWFVALWNVFIACAVIGGVWWGYNYWVNGKKDAAHEDNMRIAKSELLFMLKDKTVEYLRLESIECKQQQIIMRFDGSKSDVLRLYREAVKLRDVDSVMVNGEMMKEVAVFMDKWLKMNGDSIMKSELLSLVCIAPEKWKTFADILKKEKAMLTCAYANISEEPTLTISGDELKQLIDDEKQMAKGLDVFVKKKREEVLDYAKKHFRNDKFLKVNDVVLEKEHVCLRLDYDDSKYKIHKSMLDTTRVNPHFTDGVDDMGSILDGMLAISTRTNKGVAFVYSGTVNKRYNRVQYDAQKAKELYKEESNKYWAGDRKRDQVSTGVIMEKQHIKK